MSVHKLGVVNSVHLHHGDDEPKEYLQCQVYGL